MKIKKITKVEKQWFTLPNKIKVKTPEGNKEIDKIWYNGLIQPLLLTFINDVGEEYQIKCSEKHKFLSLDLNWVEAINLKTGQQFNNNWVFNNYVQLDQYYPTFDIEVPEEHCYILESGIISHNSNSLISGGVSSGIEPFFANVFTADSAAGEIRRANPVLVELLKSKSKWTKPIIESILKNNGSVQHLDCLNDHEKAVFRTAFEVDQMAIIRMAESRQRYIDQGQSINLFFSSEAEEEFISYVHKEAMTSPWIKSLYYIRSNAGVTGRTTLTEQKSSCSSCEG
jgi:hypothetical protein